MFNLGDLRYTVDIDTTNAQKQIKTADDKMKAFGATASSVGAKLTRSITLPLVGLAGVTLKLASDFEVASRKFNTAFAGTGENAINAVNDLNDSFGLASSTATQLLANTGDILKGFGATGNQALELSTEIQKVAVALGAYNGASAKAVSEALTSAITGERESMKQYGVIISETAVQQRLLANGTADLTGEQLLLAKAQATLEIATAQSGDAISSFGENQGTLAYQTSALLEDLKSLGVDFGSILIPSFKDLTSNLRELTKWFAALDDSTKKSILTYGALAAALPLVISAVGAVSTALAFLAANPAVLAIAGIAAVTIAVVELNKAAKQKDLDEFISKFGDVAEIAGKTSEELENLSENQKRIEGIFTRLTGLNLTVEQLGQEVSAVAQSFGLSDETLITILQSSAALSDIMQDQLVEVDRVVGAQKEELAVVNAITISREEALAYTAEYQAQRAEAVALANEELRLAQEAREELEKAQLTDDEKQIKARLEAQTEYYKAISDNQTRYNLGLIDSVELEDNRIEAVKDYADALILAGYDGSNATEMGNIALREMIALLQDVEAASTEVSDFEKDWANRRLGQTQTRIEQLDNEEAIAIEQAKKLGAEISDIEEYYAAERKKIRDEEQQDRLNQGMEWVETAVNFAQSISNAISEYNNNIRDQQLQDLERSLEVENVARTEAYNQELKDLQQKYDDGLITQDEFSQESKKLAYDLAVAEADAEWALTRAKYEADKQAFKNKQDMAYAEIWINTAMAVARAWVDNDWITALVVSGLALAMGVAQTAIVSSQPAPVAPVKPASIPTPFANGGLVNNPGAGINAIVGEAGPEAILPLTDQTFSALGGAIIDAQNEFGNTSNQESRSITIPVYLDGDIIAKSTVNDYINTNQYILTQERAI